MIERCCVACRYRPSAILRARELVALFRAAAGPAADIREDIGSIMTPTRGYELGRAEGGFGPRAIADWACYLDDLERAGLAGHADPAAASAFLCPFGAVDDADEDDVS